VLTEVIEMLVVKLEVNGRVIYARHAVNVSDEYGKGVQRYRLDNGKVVEHVYEDGAVVLARKILETEASE